MLADGILLTPNCSGALSTPMTEAEIDLLADRLVAHTIAYPVQPA
jgi:glutamate-1-semialdehyde 2,1-aminomutase